MLTFQPYSTQAIAGLLDFNGKATAQPLEVGTKYRPEEEGELCRIIGVGARCRNTCLAYLPLYRYTHYGQHTVGNIS